MQGQAVLVEEVLIVEDACAVTGSGGAASVAAAVSTAGDASCTETGILLASTVAPVAVNELFPMGVTADTADPGVHRLRALDFSRVLEVVGVGTSRAVSGGL